MKQIAYEHHRGVFEDNYDYFSNKHRLNFDKVADEEHWKNPTHETFVNSEEEALAIRDAVVYFTGTVPKIVEYFGSFNVRGAEGYYIGIGA